MSGVQKENELNNVNIDSKTMSDYDDIDWAADIEENTPSTPLPASPTLQEKPEKRIENKITKKTASPDVNIESYKRKHELSGVSCEKYIKKPKDASSFPKSEKQYENDPEVLRKRQKQIDFGKNTIGYDNYTKAVPKGSRKPGDPQTPNKYLKYSRRSFDVLMKTWRLQLHKYDNVFVEKD